MKGIDHLVLAVDDLNAARKTYEAAGFTVTPAAKHPFGTGNALVQLQGCFLELLQLEDQSKITEHDDDHFSFAAFNRDYLKHGQGCSMLVLDSADAKADYLAYRAELMDSPQPFDFSRAATLPNGEQVTVGFSLAFLRHPATPRVGYFCCQQHAPQHFWKAQYQNHANSAQTVLEICMVADDPASMVPFLRGFAFASRAEAVAADMIAIDTTRGRITIATPAAFENAYQATAPDLSAGPVLGGYTIGVTELSHLVQCLESGTINYQQTEAQIHLSMFGCAVNFEKMT